MNRDQIQQIASQIKRRTTQVGNIKPKNRKYIETAQQSSYSSDRKINVSWVKMWFINQLNSGRSINEGDFEDWVLYKFNSVNSHIITNDDGDIHDLGIPQYGNVMYAVTIKCNSDRTIRTEIDTPCYLRIETLIENGISSIIFDSSSSPNSPRKRIISIPIQAETLTTIRIFVYNSYNTDSSLNEFHFVAGLNSKIQYARSPILSPPSGFGASNGKYLNQIELAWINSQINIGSHDFIQIFYAAASDVDYQHLATLSADNLSYIHAGLNEGERYYYKARYITNDGFIGDFTDVVSGTTGSSSGKIDIILPRNSLIADDSTIGYYNNETITIRLESDVEFIDKPEVRIIEPDGETIHVIPYEDINIIESKVWEFDFDTSEIPDSNQGRAKIIAKGHLTGAGLNFGDGSEGGGSESSAGTVVKVSSFVIDRNSPVMFFTIDGDLYKDTENDPLAYTRNVGINISDDSYEPMANVHDYVNSSSQLEEYDSQWPESTPNTTDGYLCGGIYQIKAANDEQSNLDTSQWIQYYGYSSIYQWILSESEGTKTVYFKARDRAGNESTVISDDIIYNEGLPIVGGVAAASDYDRVTITWNAVTASYLNGYAIYRNTTGTTPTVIDTPYMTAGPEINTGEDFNIVKETTYYYWIRAFDSSLPPIYSESFSSRVSASAKVTPPEADTVVSLSCTGYRTYIQLGFNVPDTGYTGVNDKRLPTSHIIYRFDVTTYGVTPSLANSEKIAVLTKEQDDIDVGDNFIYNDYSIPEDKWDHEFKYTAIATNGPWLLSNEYYSQTSTINWTSSLSFEDNAPVKVEWSDNKYAAHWGVRLAWVASHVTNPADTDVTRYIIYTEAGDQTGEDPSDPENMILATVPATTAEDVVYYMHNREDILEDVLNGDASSDISYWVRAQDERGQFSDYSDAWVTGLLQIPPPPPTWVSGECKVGYGYNYLAFSGVDDPSDLLAGYNIYRAVIDINNLPTAGMTSAEITGYGGYFVHFFKQELENQYNIHTDKVDNSLFGQECCYWLSSANKYGDESSTALLTGLGTVLPNYATFFANYFDNGSFERDIADNTWSFGVGTSTMSLAGFNGPTCLFTLEINPAGIKPIVYDFIFVQPNKEYTISFYAQKSGGSTYEGGEYFSGEILWYTASELVSTSGYNFGSASALTTTSWDRYSINTTAPSNATRAQFKFAFVDADVIYPVDIVLLDAFQWEEKTDDSPTEFVDSRALSADRIMGHIIIGDMIQFGTISGGNIMADTITAENISGGSITLDKLSSIPQPPRTNYDIEPINQVHSLDLVTNDGSSIFYTYKDSDAPAGYTEYVTQWDEDANLPAYWDVSGTPRWRLYYDGADNTKTWYVYGTFDDEAETCALNVSETYPGNADFFLAKAFDHENTDPNGGYFTLPAFYGINVTIAGDQITAGQIHGKYIEAETISGDHIVGQTITADKIIISESNMLVNGNFDHFQCSGCQAFDGMRWQDSWTRRDHAVIGWSLFPNVYDYYLGMGDNAPAGAHSILFDGSDHRSGPCHNDISGEEPSSTVNWPLSFDKNKVYTFSYMCKVEEASVGKRPLIYLKAKGDTAYSVCSSSNFRMVEYGTGSPIPTIDNWSTYADDKGWVTLYIWIGPTASGATWEPTGWSTGKYTNARFALHLFGTATSASAHKMYFANLAIIEGKKIPTPYQRCEYDSTVICGTTIKTGVIDAKAVNIKSDDAVITMDNKGITVGSTTNGCYTRINASQIKYVDQDGYTTFYDYYTRYIPTIGIQGDLLNFSYYPIYLDPPLHNCPQIIGNLESLQPFSWWLTASPLTATWKYAGIFLPHWYGSNESISIARVVGNMDEYEYSAFYILSLYASNFTRTSMPIITGYWPSELWATGAITSGWDNCITYTGETSQNCAAINASFRIYVNGPCTGWTFGWGMATFTKDSGTDREILEFAYGTKTISLESGETLIWNIPHRTLRCIRPKGESGPDMMYYESPDSNYITYAQCRLWTENTYQQVAASGVVYQLGGTQYINPSLYALVQTSGMGYSTHPEDKTYIAAPYVANFILRE